jgi:hypothetical protein
MFVGIKNINIWLGTETDRPATNWHKTKEVEMRNRKLLVEQHQKTGMQ